MRVKILYMGMVRAKVGKKEEEYQIKDGSSLSDLLSSLARTHGKSFESIVYGRENRLDPTFIATVNGILKDSLRASNIPLREGDTIALMTLISGG